MSFSYSPIILTGAAGGGSSSVGGGLVTVGPSGNYPTINAAIEASHNILFVNSSYTESGDITVRESGLSITILPNASVNMGSYKFLTDNTNLYINGHGSMRYAYSSPNTLFDGNGTINVNGIKIINASSSLAYITDMNDAKFNSVTFEGNVNIFGHKNIFNGSRFSNGNIAIASGIQNTLINGSIFDGVLIIDSGNGTVISDGVIV